MSIGPALVKCKYLSIDLGFGVGKDVFKAFMPWQAHLPTLGKLLATLAFQGVRSTSGDVARSNSDSENHKEPRRMTREGE